MPRTLSRSRCRLATYGVPLGRAGHAIVPVLPSGNAARFTQWRCRATLAVERSGAAAPVREEAAGARSAWSQPFNHQPRDHADGATLGCQRQTRRPECREATAPDTPFQPGGDPSTLSRTRSLRMTCLGGGTRTLPNTINLVILSERSESKNLLWVGRSFQLSSSRRGLERSAHHLEILQLVRRHSLAQDDMVEGPSRSARETPPTGACRARHCAGATFRLRGTIHTMALPGNPRGESRRCSSPGNEAGRRRAISVIAAPQSPFSRPR